jgi:hypothetical protein
MNRFGRGADPENWLGRAFERPREDHQLKDEKGRDLPPPPPSIMPKQMRHPLVEVKRWCRRCEEREALQDRQLCGMCRDEELAKAQEEPLIGAADREQLQAQLRGEPQPPMFQGKRPVCDFPGGCTTRAQKDGRCYRHREDVPHGRPPRAKKTTTRTKPPRLMTDRQLQACTVELVRRGVKETIQATVADMLEWQKREG